MPFKLVEWEVRAQRLTMGSSYVNMFKRFDGSNERFEIEEHDLADLSEGV